METRTAAYRSEAHAPTRCTLMPDDHDYLSEDEATRLWHRAARMQAEAARMAEARASEEGREEEPADDAPDDGYALTHVRSAALEAGIGEEFVEAALADLRAERAIETGTNSAGRRLAKRVLGNPEEAVTARRVIQASPATVLAAMEKILPQEPYGMLLKDRQGDPVQGGILVFDLQGIGFSQGGQPGFKGDASWADLRQVFATLREMDGGRACELTLRSPVAWAWGLNAGFGAFFSVLGGGLGLGLGSGLAAMIAAVTATLGFGVLAAALAATAVAAGAGGGLVAGTAGFRALYRHSMGKGTSALESAIHAVAAEAQGGWGLDSIGGSQEPPALPEGTPESS